MWTIIFSTIGILMLAYALYSIVMLFYVLSKDPFDVFSEEDNYVPPVEQPFTNQCSGRNYWI